MSAAGWDKVTPAEAAEMAAEVRAETLREAAEADVSPARTQAGGET